MLPWVCKYPSLLKLLFCLCPLKMYQDAWRKQDFQRNYKSNSQASTTSCLKRQFKHRRNRTHQTPFLWSHATNFTNQPFFFSQQTGQSAETMKIYRWLQNVGLGNAEHIFIKAKLYFYNFPLKKSEPLTETDNLPSRSEMFDSVQTLTCSRDVSLKRCSRSLFKWTSWLGSAQLPPSPVETRPHRS